MNIMVTRGFWGRRSAPENRHRIPPGQHQEFDFPVLSAGPTPRVRLEDWTFTLKAGVRPIKRWSWAEFNALPRTTMTRDIHCVTTWTKLDTKWEGVLIEDILRDAAFVPTTEFVLAHCVDGYSTNVPLADLIDGKSMIALLYDGAPLEPDHGGPARLLVPHLYFWKSAKWVNGLQFTNTDTAGFWELRGYHMRGDPFKQQRYSDDD
jgi:DMSO/TMAO reductase YedYZ molybdopterin-dependent catalytic subunit